MFEYRPDLKGIKTKFDCSAATLLPRFEYRPDLKGIKT